MKYYVASERNLMKFFENKGTSKNIKGWDKNKEIYFKLKERNDPCIHVLLSEYKLTSY